MYDIYGPERCCGVGRVGSPEVRTHVPVAVWYFGMAYSPPGRPAVESGMNHATATFYFIQYIIYSH
jgi:hypothetical protein